MKTQPFTPFTKLSTGIASIALAVALNANAQTGPFPATNWPPTIKADAKVHYYIAQRNAGFTTPNNDHWVQSVSFADDGDQTFDYVTRNGLKGLQSTSTFMNIADKNFKDWADAPVVDVLLQVYGDKTLLKTNSTSGREVLFRIGTLGSENLVSAGDIPAGANNGQWNWMVFSVTNAVNPKTSKRYLGDVPDSSQANVENGGVNGGTLRIENLPGVTIRAVAIGEHGAFGKPEEINVMAPAGDAAKGK